MFFRYLSKCLEFIGIELRHKGCLKNASRRVNLKKFWPNNHFSYEFRVKDLIFGPQHFLSFFIETGHPPKHQTHWFSNKKPLLGINYHQGSCLRTHFPLYLTKCFVL